jgi:hypothetical protein
MTAIAQPAAVSAPAIVVNEIPREVASIFLGVKTDDHARLQIFLASAVVQYRAAIAEPEMGDLEVLVRMQSDFARRNMFTTRTQREVLATRVSELSMQRKLEK